MTDLSLAEQIADDVLKLARLDIATDRELKKLYPLCKSTLHTPTLESPSLNSLVQVVSSLYAYRDNLLEREERVCKSLLHMVASDNGRVILKYLFQNGCISNLELYRHLGVSRQAVMWNLNILEDRGLIRVYATVEDERLPAHDRGAKIRGWLGMPPECSQQAIQRYLDFFKKEVAAKPQEDLDLEEEGYEAILLRVHDRDIFESEAKAALEPLFPNGLDRIKYLNTINKKLMKAGIRLVRNK